MNVTDIVRRVAPWASGCPTPIIEQALSDTMRRFCIDTEIWEADLPIEYTLAGVREVPLTAPGISTVHALIAVSVNAADDDGLWSFAEPATLIFDTAPATGGLTVEVTATLATGSGETALPAVLEPWELALSYGAIRDLTEQPGKSWSSPEYNALYTARYDEQVRKARGQNHDRRGKRFARLRTTKYGSA